jgi:dihydroorotate dehydrogenase (fumarate)
MKVDLHTKYLGFDLHNPLVVSACPLGEQLDTLRRLQDAGAAAVVLPSLFEEQIEHEDLEVHWLREYGTENFAESLTYFPVLRDATADPDSYLLHIEKAKDALSIPVIASLNGTTKGGWVRYARRIEEVGADAIELNIYLIATDPDISAEQVEAQHLDLVGSVRRAVKIPLAVKIGPYFSSMANMAKRLVQAGADGLVLFNRFLQPDIDLKTLQVTPHLVLSSSQELRLPLRWIAILRGRVRAYLAATSGVHTAEDVVKLLLAGADVTMTASALLQHGPNYLGTLLDGVRAWMEQYEYRSVQQMKGSLSQVNCPEPALFERANYMNAIASYTGVLHSGPHTSDRCEESCL